MNVTSCTTHPANHLQARDSLFDFSDDEDETSFGWAQRTKFKIHIKSKVSPWSAMFPATVGCYCEHSFASLLLVLV
jgi:hypothetical protein